MIGGYILGCRLRHKRERFLFVEELTNIVIYILVLIMGLRMGSNEEVTSSLGTIGLQSLMITVMTVGGSMVFVFFARRILKLDKEGMPIREELFCKDGTVTRRVLGIPSGRKVLLVVGGSSGAEFLNDAVRQLLPALTSLCTVIHVTGKGKFSDTERRDGYIPLEYSDDMGSLYAASDVVLSRAGATAVAEISALKKRAVFVPLPKGISRGDQIPNAELTRRYGATVLAQDDKFIHKLYPVVKKAFDSAPMKRIADDANGKIAELVDDTIRRGVKCKDKKR